MPGTHVDTMISLGEIVITLDQRQAVLDDMRHLHQGDQLRQLMLDRRQTDINDRRKWVYDMIRDIASRN